MSDKYDQWFERGQRLGYEGEKLEEYVEKRIKESFQREERLRNLEIAREKEVAEQRKAEAEQREREYVLKEKEREQEHKRQIELLQLRQEQGINNGIVPRQDAPRSSRPKLPSFDEQRDDIDAYLERFERFAKSQSWTTETWAISLSPLLTGKGLDVYASMAPDEANNYEALKIALLKRYQLTEEGFRGKFRESKPQKEETVVQYVARLRRYLTRWMELSGIEHSYDALSDLMLREQFISMCSQELAMFLKERVPKTIAEVTKLAEQYVEAHGVSLITSRPTRSAQPVTSRPPQSTNVQTQQSSQHDSKSDRPKKCFICHQDSHFARDCPKNRKNKTAAAAHQTQEEQPQQRQKGSVRRRRQQRSQSPNDWRKRDPDEQRDNLRTSTGASCQSDIPPLNLVDGCVKDGRLQLANGQSIPYAGALCNDHKIRNGLPLCQGYVGDRLVEVLRDTGCNTAAIKRDIIKDNQLNGKVSSCVLMDGTLRQFPMATITVDTPYFSGEVDAMCMPNPIHDLIIGNIPGVKPVPDPNWQRERIPCKASAVTTRAMNAKEKHQIKPLVVPAVTIEEIGIKELKKQQDEDETLTKLWKHAEEEHEFTGKGQRSYRYVVTKDVLYRIYTQRHGGTVNVTRQIVVPTALRKRVMELAHESIVGGHLGSKKTMDRITSAFFWPGINGDVTRFCRSCDTCQRTIPKGKVTKVPLGEMPIIDAPFERIAIDLVGPIAPMSEAGNRYILTVVDYATRYPEAVPLKKIETERISEALLEIFSRVGFPKEVLSDRGTQFTSDLMKEVSRLVSIKQLFTTPYNPKCNGLCEKMNGTLKSMLRKMCQERPKDWDRYLPAVLFAYREAPQASTGFSPFELLYGRTVRGPMQILKEIWTEAETPETQNTYQYVLDLRNRLEETCQIARESLMEAKEDYKHHYDKKTKNRIFKVGQKVYILLPTDHNKLLLQWKGPYEVVEVLNRMDYKVKVDGKDKIYHANLLKLYIPRDGDDIRKTDGRQGKNFAATVAVIEPSDADGVVDDENLLDLLYKTQEETYLDVNVNPDLTPQQTQDVKDLLKEFQDIFTEKPGCTTLVKHKIDVTTKQPIRVKPYPMPYAKRKDVDDEVQKMLKANVIEESCSDYNSPIVLVKKKDGSNRFCIDFRQLNTVTKFDTEPMGSTEDIMAKLCDDKYFTKIDLAKGYWQIPMEEEAKPMTSFTTNNGSYQFRMMPFGLINSGASFNKMMRKLLKGCSNVDNYVDDILGHTVSWDAHMSTLRDIFHRIREASLTVRPSKCYIGYGTIDFTGHVVGKGEIRTEEDKVNKIRNATQPTTKKEVQAFIGLANYYRKFIPNFATIAAPLTDLTKGGMPKKVVWDKPQEHAFKTLRDLLTSSPILRLADLSRHFILRTDASDVGVGAVLLQEYEDGIFPVAYASKKLLDRERNYSVIERECLAIVYGVKKFQKYLYGKEFIIQTDHAPLSYIQKCRAESGRIMRWSLFLQNYRFRIEAIKGSENVGADYLSRQ